MKFLKIALIAIVLLVNLAIAPAAWAGKDFTKGADYAEVTQAITQLMQYKDAPEQAGYTPETYQQRLSQLQQQKYVMETANKRAQCHNQTTGTIGVYANKPKKSPTQLYFLAAGNETDDDWDCDGFFLPAGTPVVLTPGAEPETLTEGIAVQFVDGTQSFARTNLTGAVELNVAPAKVFKAGETAWNIPGFSQAEINAQTPTPQIID